MSRLFFSCLLFFVASFQVLAQNTYSNPVVNDSLSEADVTVVKNGKHDYYMFYTHVLGVRTLYHSTNLVDWHDTGVIPYTKQTAENIKNFAKGISQKYPFCLWAPHIVKVGKKWVMYTSIENWGGIIALQSDKITGPYDFVGEPYALVSNADMGWPYDAIDPCVVNDKGKLYLFFGSAFGIYRTELTKDGLHVKDKSKFTHVAGPIGPNTKVDGVVHGGMEGVFVFKRKSWWYLLCSKRLDYSIYAGRSKKISGVFVDKDGRLMSDGYGTRMNFPTSEFLIPGHNGEIYKDKDGKYFIFYHSKTGNMPNNRYGHVQPILSEMFWDKEGFPYVKNRKTEKDDNIRPRL